VIEIISNRDHDSLKRKLEAIRGRNVALDARLWARVAAIIDDVRERGDAALIDYAERFDGVALTKPDLKVSRTTLLESAARVDPEVLVALREAIRRVRAFHERERSESWDIQGPQGERLGQRVTPIERAGLYVPGGTASYPSSVIMNVVPAQVAGVARIVIATPPRSIENNPAVAATLLELNIDEVYGVGGAQAIAALAYGTETVPQVDKITGPGNQYVAAAKRLVFGVVGIDSLAGPSEIVIVADDTARASLVASDLLAQAEHAPDASAILITTSESLAAAVAAEVVTQSATLSRSKIVGQSLAEYGAIVTVPDMAEACDLVNQLAPEHLEIICRNDEAVAAMIRHAGAIFLGDQTPEAVGDYLAGPNHVLPTSGAARFSSALSVSDFQKRTSILRFNEAALKTAAPMIATLARAEGLEGHARSALIRLQESGAQ
jgi:histidinol dehydrogenase